VTGDLFAWFHFHTSAENGKGQVQVQLTKPGYSITLEYCKGYVSTNMELFGSM
jgi:hypothetical protein